MAETIGREFEVDSEGITIRGAYYLADNGADGGKAPVLAILHGIPRAKPQPGDDSYRDMARRFASLGFLAVVFNFRGSGVSDGDISMAGWVKDLKAVLEMARALPGADASRVALLGFSAGGSAAIRVAAEDPGIGAVLSVSSPADYNVMLNIQPAAQWVALFKEIGLIRDPDFPPSLEEWEAEFADFNPLPWAEKLRSRRTLIAHGEKDELIPAEHARRLAEAAGVEPVFVRGGAHRLRVDPAALALVEDWLRDWLAGGSGG